MPKTSQAQGAQFENLLYELLRRLLSDDLNYELMDHILQGSGIQYGKDIQTRWRFRDGQEAFWHFECKSHNSGVLHQKEVADKVIDVYRSAHRIDAWCLALAHIEPSQWIDEFFPWATRNFYLPFSLEVLSPRRGFIKELFACHPDLFRELYPSEDLPFDDGPDRATRIAAFDAFLHEATARGREAADHPAGSRDSEWELIIPDRMKLLPDNVSELDTYLRGRLSVVWEAVAYDWPIARKSAETAILERIDNAGPGLSYCWVLGPGGEGKSTVLRRIAWRIAKDPSTIVLWTDQDIGYEAVDMPIRWLDQLRHDSKVLLCIDGTPGVRGIGSALRKSRSYAAENKRVFLLLADRAYDWKRSRARRELQRDSQFEANVHELQPLHETERAALVRKLADRSLLHTSLSSAVTELTNAAERPPTPEGNSWLLPTLMQITDPRNRGFDRILMDVLTGLVNASEAGALRLLIAASLLHASGVGLPRELAQRLLQNYGGLESALPALKTEIEEQWGGDSGSRYTGFLVQRFFNYHRVVAEGIVTQAYRPQSGHRESLLAVCGEIPTVVGPSLDPVTMLYRPKSYFHLLDRTVDYLYKERALFVGAYHFLTAWINLDDRQFPAMHRLADCYSRWYQVASKDGSLQDSEVQHLIEAARTMYREFLSTAERVLTDPPEDRPARFADYKLDAQEHLGYHGWAVLESKIALNSKDDAVRESLLLRATTLALLAFSPSDMRQNARSCDVLSFNLFQLGEYRMAAVVASATKQLGGYAGVVQIRRRELRSKGYELPPQGTQLLSEVFSELATGRLLDKWREIGLFDTSSEHMQHLSGALRVASQWMPQPQRLTDAIDLLEGSQKEATDSGGPLGKPALG